jgi:tRNA threonylcarbamoyladenosine biosynthesis protein TsaB
VWLALETSGDCASVAVGITGRVLGEAELAGTRQHATGLPGLIDQALDQAGATSAEVEGIVLADGPGGFTGLRIGAAVAKALIRTRRRPFWSVPSLIAMAASAGESAEGALIVAVGDALRGELFAAAIRYWPGRLETVLSPGVWLPDVLPARCPEPDLVVVRDEGAPALPSAWADRPRLARKPAARDLLALIGVSGGARLITDPAGWEPQYGRPAEAQARWEATHGRPIPDSPSHLR